MRANVISRQRPLSVVPVTMGRLIIEYFLIVVRTDQADTLLVS